MRTPTLLLLIPVLPLFGGCTLSSRYSLRIEEPQKDVLLVEVEVPRPLNTQDYRQIAEREMDGVLRVHRRFDVPVYEVRFEYFAPVDGTSVEERVATYVCRPDATAADSTAALSTASYRTSDDAR